MPIPNLINVANQKGIGRTGSRQTADVFQSPGTARVY